MSVTFQPPSRSLTNRDIQFIALAVVLLISLAVGLVFINLKLEHGGDFYVHWVAARGFLFEKVDPYSGQVPARVQQLVYAGGAQPGQEPFFLDTPFQLLPFYYPFALFSDPAFARAVFTMLLDLALLALAVLSLVLTEWKAPLIFTVPFLILAVFNFYAWEAIQEASPVLILGLVYAGILFALRNDMDEVAGALLAASLYYWEVGGPFLVLVLLRVYAEKRSRVFAGFFMLSFILFFISFLSYPYWIIPFLRAAVNNLRADFGLNLFKFFAQVWPAHGGTLAWVFIISLIVALGYEWSLARTGDERRFYWTAGLSLAAAPLLGFRTEMEHLAVLIIPLALMLSIVHDRWNRHGNLLTLLLMLIMFIVPWSLSLFAVGRLGAWAEEITYIFLPLTTVVGLYWIRWWAIRPPRTWKDLANQL
ncbi:MAG: hypothetical protein K8S20_12480 [Chloroflexi bacterium]|nr:hypothetical protein [Chloroflexota bacterium]